MWLITSVSQNVNNIYYCKELLIICTSSFDTRWLGLIQIVSSLSMAAQHMEVCTASE